MEATTEPLTEAVGNLFPESWFMQTLDGTGELIANEPAKVSWTGETSGQQRGVVARIDSATTLAEAGDFLEMAFTTAGMPIANNLRYSLRFGFYNDNGNPVTADFSTTTTAPSSGFPSSWLIEALDSLINSKPQKELQIR